METRASAAYGGIRLQEIKTVSDEVKIQRGFPDELRSSAAELYDAAFGAKLSIAMPNPISRIAVLAEGFDPRFSFVAIRGNELVGIAGFKVAQGSLTGGISLRVLKNWTFDKQVNINRFAK